MTAGLIFCRQIGDHKLIAITRQMTRCDGNARFRSSLLCVWAIACSIASVAIAVSKALNTVPDSTCGDISENSLSCIPSQDIWASSPSLSRFGLNRTVLAQAGCEIWYLPPYSPCCCFRTDNLPEKTADLNQIEHWWFVLKNWMRQRWDEFDSFRDCVDAAFKHCPNVFP